MAINSAVDWSFQHSSSPDLVFEVRELRASISEILAAIEGSTSHQDAIAARSYWHPNGFIKLVLGEQVGGGEVRMHIWPTHPHNQDIHGHAWAYRSIVLAGELTEISYRESDSETGQPMWRHSYQRVRGRRFAFSDVCPVHLTQVGSRQVHRRDDNSGGGADHIHRFFASATPAVTLLRVGPLATLSSSIYRPTPEPPPITKPRPTSSDDVRYWLSFVATTAGI